MISQGNTYIFQITSSNFGLLSDYSRVNYLDGYYFKNIDLISTFNYPTTTYAGPLTGNGPTSLSADGYVVFDSVSSGGPISNYTYEDFSGKNSKINLGLFFCNPTIILSLSSYDESVSPITTIIYEEYNTPNILTPSITVTTISSVDIFNLASPKNIPISLYPKTTEKYTTIYESRLSVLKLDATMNTFTLVASVLQCGILDVFDSTNILNSQILDDPKKVLLTFENKRTKTVYNNIINTDIPFYLLTGGEVVELDTDVVEPDAVFELEPANETFVTEQLRQISAPTIPEPKPKINPVKPNLSEYLYRGERGIRIRPLLTTLLPGEEFYYARPESGLIILSGGAPYYPGLGILYNLEFRQI
jgi:hypothetical protein